MIVCKMLSRGKVTAPPDRQPDKLRKTMYIFVELVSCFVLENAKLNVDDYLRKSSLTGPEILVLVFSYVKEEDSVKKIIK